MNDKNLPVALSAFRAEELARIERAAKEQDSHQVLAVGRRLNRIERIIEELARLTAEYRRLESEVGAPDGGIGTSPADAAPGKSTDGNVNDSDRRDSRRHARERRADFLEELAGSGIRMSHHRGVVYTTSSGERVALPFGIESRPGRWFLGHADATFDQVVLLCDQADGQLEWFALDRDFFVQHGAHLSRQRGGRNEQIKFVVVWRGSSFALSIPREGDVDLSLARRNLESLR